MLTPQEVFHLLPAHVVPSSRNSQPSTNLHEEKRGPIMTLHPNFLDNVPHPIIETMIFNFPRVLWFLEKKIRSKYEAQMITSSDLTKVEDVKQEVERILSEFFTEGISLNLYGSVMTGFRSNKLRSMDLSVKVNSEKSYAKDKQEVLFKVFELLWNSDENCTLYRCLLTQMPKIVLKNWHGFEISLTYDNTPELEITELFQEYREWAPELLPQLVYLVKKWTEAVKLEGFESFHQILLIIYYLQRVGYRSVGENTKVLPFLQNDFWPGDKSDMPWKYFTKNASPGRSEKCMAILHFYDLFYFYIDLDFSSSIIQIINRQKFRRRRSETNDAVVMRHPFSLGRSKFKKLTPSQKKIYKRDYKAINIAGDISQLQLAKMKAEMRTTVRDIEHFSLTGHLESPMRFMRDL